MEIYLKLFEVLFPVFLIVGLGYHLGKKNPDFDTSFITTYAGNFGTPALVIFAITAGGVSFELFSEYFGYAIILLTLYGFKDLRLKTLTPKGFFIFPRKIDNKSDSNDEEVGPGPAPSPCKTLSPTGLP